MSKDRCYLCGDILPVEESFDAWPDLAVCLKCQASQDEEIVAACIQLGLRDSDPPDEHGRRSILLEDR